MPRTIKERVTADISIPADGSSTTTITSGTVLYNDGSVVNDGTLITIKADKGTLLATDADSGIKGLQVATVDGVISFYDVAYNESIYSNEASSIPSSCEGDFDDDGDVDGSDLAVFAVGGTTITLEDFAADFGRINCP